MTLTFLERCTTTSTFVCKCHLTGVKDMARGLTVRCNTRKVQTNRCGNFGRLKVWAINNSIANVLSLSEIVKVYCVTFNSLDKYFVVRTPKGEVPFAMEKHSTPALHLN